MTALRRGPGRPAPFADDPDDPHRPRGGRGNRLASRASFLWDHLVWSDTGEGPPILDPWQILAVVAARDVRGIRLGQP